MPFPKWSQIYVSDSKNTWGKFNFQKNHSPLLSRHRMNYGTVLTEEKKNNSADTLYESSCGTLEWICDARVHSTASRSMSEYCQHGQVQTDAKNLSPSYTAYKNFWIT